MPTSEQDTKFFPRGNCIVTNIVVFPTQGLIIRWARPDLKETTIYNQGIESPLFELIRRTFPDPKKIPGAALFIETDEEGNVLTIGKQGGEIISITQDSDNPDL